MIKSMKEVGAEPLFHSSAVLGLACERDAELAEVLVQHGANPNVTIEFINRKPLNIASAAGKEDVVKVLLEHGADVNGAKEGGREKDQAEGGREKDHVDVRMEDGSKTAKEWPLLAACRNGRFRLAQLLLKHNSRVFNPPLPSLPFILINVRIGTRRIAYAPDPTNSLRLPA